VSEQINIIHTNMILIPILNELLLTNPAASEALYCLQPVQKSRHCHKFSGTNRRTCIHGRKLL